MKTGLLFSGGMDSLSLLWWKRPDTALTIDYGQLAAKAEISAASTVCKQLGIPHHTLHVNCRELGSGDMAGSQSHKVAPETDWWPYRNQLLITLAAMKALPLEINCLWLGTVKSDEVHIDGTPQFIESISNLLSLQEGNLIVDAPAIKLSTIELIQASGIPAKLLAWAHSCHKANIPCGNCRGCNKYYQTFEILGYDLDRPGQPQTA